MTDQTKAKIRDAIDEAFKRAQLPSLTEAEELLRGCLQGVDHERGVLFQAGIPLAIAKMINAEGEPSAEQLDKILR
jgi:hypothetical protein